MGDNLLECYNPLYDVHLRQYFALPHMQKHLRNLGLLDGSQVQSNNNELHAGHVAMMDMMLRNRERVLQQLMDLQRKLDAAEKVELYRRIRSGLTNADELDVRNTHMSRSLSRPARSAAARLEGAGGRGSGRRRQSLSPEAGELIKRVETDYRSDSAPFKNPKSIYNRLAANVYKYQYLHKLDDRTLHKYMHSLRKQLAKLERFREVSFGPHTMAKHAPTNLQQSWFFRRRSLKSGLARSGKSQSPQRLTRSGIDEPPVKMQRRRTSVSRTRVPATAQQPRLPPLPKKRNFAASRQMPSSAPANRLPPTAVIRPTRKAPEQQRRPPPTPSKKTPPTTAGSRPSSKGSTTPVPVQKPPSSGGAGILPAIGAGVAAAAVAATVAAAAASDGGKATEEEEHQRDSVAPSPSVSLAASQTTTTDGGQPGADSEWEGDHQQQEPEESGAAGGTETRPTPEPFLEKTEGEAEELVPGMEAEDQPEAPAEEADEQMTARESVQAEEMVPVEDVQPPEAEEMTPMEEEHPEAEEAQLTERASLQAEEMTPAEEEQPEEVTPVEEYHPEPKAEEVTPEEEVHHPEHMSASEEDHHPEPEEMAPMEAEYHPEEESPVPEQQNDMFQREGAPSPEEHHAAEAADEEQQHPHPAMEEEEHHPPVEEEESHHPPTEPEEYKDEVDVESIHQPEAEESLEHPEDEEEVHHHPEAEEEPYHPEESARSKRSIGSEEYGVRVPEEDGLSLDAAESDQIRRAVHPNIETEAGPTDSVRSLASSSGREETEIAHPAYVEAQKSIEAEEEGPKSPEAGQEEIIDINGNVEEHPQHHPEEEVPQYPAEAEEESQLHLEAEEEVQHHPEVEEEPLGHPEAEEEPQGHPEVEEEPQGHPEAEDEALLHPEELGQPEEVLEGMATYPDAEHGFERVKRETDGEGEEEEECPPEGCRLPTRSQAEEDEEGLVQSEEVVKDAEDDPGRKLSETEEMLKEHYLPEAEAEEDTGRDEHPEPEEPKEEEEHLVESDAYGSVHLEEEEVKRDELEEHHHPEDDHPPEDAASLKSWVKPAEDKDDVHPPEEEAEELEQRRHSSHHPAEDHPEEHPEDNGSRPATAGENGKTLLGQPSIEITPASEYGGSVEGSLVSPQVYGQADTYVHHHPEEVAEEPAEIEGHPHDPEEHSHHPEETTEEDHPLHPEEVAEERTEAEHSLHPEEEHLHHPEEVTEAEHHPEDQHLVNGHEHAQMNGQNGVGHEATEEEAEAEADERTSLLGNGGGNGHVLMKDHHGADSSSDETEGADEGSDREGSVIIHRNQDNDQQQHFQTVKLEQYPEAEQQNNNNNHELGAHGHNLLD